MESKFDRVIEAVCHDCNVELCGYIKPHKPCALVNKISAILSDPDVIVVDGVEWVPEKPSEYTATIDDVTVIAKKDGAIWKCFRYIGLVPLSRDLQLSKALSAATAATKEGAK
jgi:hypothetical protein